MNVGGITNSANNLAEENFTSSQVLEFINDAIAKINIFCGSNFPSMDIEDANDYSGFPEKWQRALFIPFVVGRIKQVETSQFEYTDNYNEFNNNLNLFRSKYNIPPEYQDTDEISSIEPNFDGNNYLWNAPYLGVGPLDIISTSDPNSGLNGKTNTVK